MMPRTIESIVENHRRATELRRSGRPIWSKTINIKNILDPFSDIDHPNEEQAASVANKIAALFRASYPAETLQWSTFGSDEELIEMVEELESLRPDSYADDPSYSVLQDVNNILDRLYDWADRERVWLG